MVWPFLLFCVTLQVTQTKGYSLFFSTCQVKIQRNRTNHFVKIILLFCVLCVRTPSPEGRKCALKEYSLVLCPARPKNQRNAEKKRIKIKIFLKNSFIFAFFFCLASQDKKRIEIKKGSERSLFYFVRKSEVFHLTHVRSSLRFILKYSLPLPHTRH